MKLLSIILIFIVLMISYHGYGQSDTSQPGKWDVSVRGNINISGGHYNAFAGSLRTSPYSYNIGGNVGLKIGNVDIPLTLVYRDHSLGLSKPFFNAGISPKWKNTTFHLGYRNLRFSRYTLGGATFFGAGAETRISFLRLGAMYGTFQNPLAQKDTIIFGTVLLPSFERKGYSFKLGFGNDRNFFDIVMLKVKDDIKSFADLSEAAYSPKDNLVVGINSQFNLSKWVTLKVDGAISGLTNDLSDINEENEEPIISKIRDLLEVNNSTNLYYAGESELRLNFKQFKPFVRYRRVSPYYQSFGINYLTSDTEDLTFGFSGMAFKNTLRFMGQVGIQKNNLLNHKSNTSNRFIGTMSLSYQSKKPLRVNLLYNNYDISITPTALEVNDTLQLVRVMNQLRLTPSYTIKGTSLFHTISMTAMVQGINSQQFIADVANSFNKYATMHYTLFIKDKKLNIGAGLEFNQNQDLVFTRDRYGFNTSVSKPFLKDKLSASYQLALYNNLINGKNDGAMLRTGINTNYRLTKKQSVTFSLHYINRQSRVFPVSADIQSRINYNISF